MSEAVNPVGGGQAAGPAGGVQGKGGGAGAAPGYDSNTTISSMADLKEKAPKVYQAMEQGIAMQIIGQMRRANERLKKLMQEARRDNRR